MYGHRTPIGLESSIIMQQAMSTLLQVRLLCSWLLLQFQGYCLPRSVSQTSHLGAVKSIFFSCRSLTWHTYCVCHVKSSSTHPIYLPRNREASTQVLCSQSPESFRESWYFFNTECCIANTKVIFILALQVSAQGVLLARCCFPWRKTASTKPTLENVSNCTEIWQA